MSSGIEDRDLGGIAASRSACLCLLSPALSHLLTVPLTRKKTSVTLPARLYSSRMSSALFEGVLPKVANVLEVVLESETTTTPESRRRLVQAVSGHEPMLEQTY